MEKDNQPNAKVEIVQVKDFSCSQLPGISFKYPVFKDWSQKGIDTSHVDECTVWFNLPNGVEAYKPPRINVKKIHNMVLAGKLKRNPQGIGYAPLKDPAGMFDLMEFQLTNFGVQIGINIDDIYGFSRDAFWQKVVDTFQYTPPEPQ